MQLLNEGMCCYSSSNTERKSPRFFSTTAGSLAAARIVVTPTSCSCSLRESSTAHHQGVPASGQRFTERLHRPLLIEHFRNRGRKKWYETVAEMQKDLYDCPKRHYIERSHQGCDMKGRTPDKAFVDRLPKIEKQEKKDTKKTAQFITRPRVAASGEYYLCTVIFFV